MGNRILARFHGRMLRRISRFEEIGRRFHLRLRRATSNSPAVPFSRARGQLHAQHCNSGRMRCASTSSLEAKGSSSGGPNTPRRQLVQPTLRSCPRDTICAAWRHGRGGPISRESGVVSHVISPRDLQSSPCASRDNNDPPPHPSPTRGGGADRSLRHGDSTSQKEAHQFVAKCRICWIRIVIAGLDPAIHPAS